MKLDEETIRNNINKSKSDCYEANGISLNCKDCKSDGVPCPRLEEILRGN